MHVRAHGTHTHTCVRPYARRRPVRMHYRRGGGARVCTCRTYTITKVHWPVLQSNHKYLLLSFELDYPYHGNDTLPVLTGFKRSESCKVAVKGKLGKYFKGKDLF